MLFNYFSKMILLFAVQGQAIAYDTTLLPAVPENKNPEVIWQNYCVGKRESSEIPRPNYNSQEVIAAATKLSMISPYSFYFYSGPLYVYGLKKGTTLLEAPAEFPQNIPQVKDGHKNAHVFLTVLCGEFRDRPSLIEAKINWVNRLYTLPVATSSKRTLKPKEDLWAQVTANDYQPYISASRVIFDAKQREQLQKTVGIFSTNDTYYGLDQKPIEPFSVCETKYIFSNFVFDKKIDLQDPSQIQKFDLQKYRKGLVEFQKKSCLPEDLDSIYDFRGDSNFKPNSPESNGMIWYSSAIASNCERTEDGLKVKSKSADKVSDSQICEKYFTSPFAYRWAAARAGLATWLMRDTKYDQIFSNSRARVDIIPHLDPFSKPFSFKVGVSAEDLENAYPSGDKYYTYGSDGMTKEISKDEYDALMKSNEEKQSAANVPRNDFLPNWSSHPEFWKQPDLGFNSITKNGEDKGLSFKLLNSAVNRHTDWYASGYEDSLEGKRREQAYSPFVASSYEMSASNAFTSPGTTVSSPADGCKHWMFVFKLKKSQWYNSQSIADKQPVNFNTMWFDETSLGTNNLADSERAFDRLGTALEGEMDAILYLHNIESGRNVNGQCGQAQMQ